MLSDFSFGEGFEKNLFFFLRHGERAVRLRLVGVGVNEVGKFGERLLDTIL